MLRVKKALRAGADVNIGLKNSKTALFFANENRHIHLMSFLLSCPGIEYPRNRGKGWWEKRLDRLRDIAGQQLIQKIKDGTSWRSALKRAKLNGANINATDQYGRTALFVACNESMPDCAEELLKLPSLNINLKDHAGVSALMVSVQKGFIRIVQMLVRAHGIDLNTKGRLGMSALMMSAESGNMDSVKAILNGPEGIHAVDVLAKDDKGRTASAIAAFRGHHGIMRRLENAAKRRKKWLRQQNLQTQHELGQADNTKVFRSKHSSDELWRPADLEKNDEILRTVERQHEALQYEQDFHEAKLQRRHALQRGRSLMRTAHRLEARKKLKSSSLLRQLEAFKTLNKHQFDVCIDMFDFLEYENGATILLQGQIATQFMVLVRGTCKVMQLIDTNSSRRLQRTIRMMKAPCFFGESALLSDNVAPRRSASVVAATESGLSVYILSLTRDTFDKLVEDGILSEDSVRTTHEAASQSSRHLPLCTAGGHHC